MPFAGGDTNSRDQLGATPLHRASGPGHSGVVRLLLAADKTIVDCQVGVAMAMLLDEYHGGPIRTSMATLRYTMPVRRRGMKWQGCSSAMGLTERWVAEVNILFHVF